MWRPIPTAALLLALACSGSEQRNPDTANRAPDASPAPATRGTLRVALFGAGGAGQLHTTTFVKGPAYQGTSDSDLRGFLDGRFQYGWNQPLQVHVRIGRRRSSPRYGETELFRVLQKWDDLGLPRESHVEHAKLEVGVEWGLERELRVVLYAVHGDWQPGQGGEHRDNNAPPEPGDVWWGDRAYQSEPWGLPGAGFASDVHPGADTPGTALADAHYRPGDASLVFDSPGLADYVAARVRERAGLRFLIKLADADEDTADTLLYLFSAEHGDHRNPVRRPRLELQWRSDSVQRDFERELVLEPGRSFETPRLPTASATRVAASLAPAEGSGAWTLELREGTGSEAGPWLPVGAPRSLGGAGWVQVRAMAAHNPVALGRPFETWLRDTWVRSGPPETREIRFTFVAPSGARHEELASYSDDYRWDVSILPTELGTWRYFFEHELEHPYESAEGRFDVLPLERAGVVSALEALLEELSAAPVALDAHRVPELAPSFWRLERALLALETPESFRAPGGRERFALLTRIREVLGDRPAPDAPPLKPAKREW